MAGRRPSEPPPPPPKVLPGRARAAQAAFAGFLAFSAGEPARAKAHLERAQNCAPGLRCRFVLFVLEEALASTTKERSGDQSMDLVRPTCGAQGFRVSGFQGLGRAPP